MTLQEKRYTHRFALLAVIFLLVLLLSMQLGRYQISAWEQLRMLFTRLTGGEPFWEKSTGKVLFEIRLPRIGAALDAIMNHAGAEYMDCYNAGIPADVWLAAGFTERVEGDGCIIPNYLTPPLHENTEYYYFTNKPENFVLFKADGDQDRPNLK